MIVEKVQCVVRRAKIVIYEPSARRHFSRMSALFEARAAKERVRHLRECAEYKSSRMEVCTIFFETNIISDRVPFVNRWRLPLGLPMTNFIKLCYGHSNSIKMRFV
jgi:hypothetical protein